ncbi:MAG: hypothetical protein IKM80_01555 [Bacilli bacterium]|nr:hypothetical protein [Bacilli bacterium]
MGDYTNRYYGGINKECQIRSNTFHSHANAHHVSIDTKKLEEQETLSSASSTAAQTATTSATTTTTAAASSTAAVSTSAAVAGGTAAAVATATVVVVASAIFVPSVNEFKYESTANTLSYSFELNYKNADSAVVVLENRLEKYEQFFELESYFPEEEMADNDEGFFAFEEGRFTDLTPSTTYRLSVSVIDGDNTYDVFSERVKTNDIPASDFVITADFSLNEETQCLDGTISIDDPGHYYNEGSIYAEIIDNYSSYPEITDASGNPFEDHYDEEREQLRRVYEISDLSATQSFYVGGLEGGDNGLTLAIYATSTYEGEPSSKPYFQKNYAYSAPVTYVTFNFYNDDGTVLWDTQTIPYGEQVFYAGETNLDEEADRRSSDTKTYFLGWASSVGGEPYDGEMYAFEDRDYYAVFGEKIYTVTFLNEDGTEVLATQYAYSGDEVYYPYDDPQKEPTETIQYIFVGWDTVPNGTHGLREFPSVTEDAWYYACFIEEERLYTVTFYDGQSAMYYSSTTYGETWSIDGSDVGSEDFWKEPDANGCYEFDHFEDANGNTIESNQEFTITEDMDIYMIFTIYAESVHVIFKNYDGTVLQDDYQEASEGYEGIYYHENTPEAPEPEEEGGIMEFYGWHCEETGTDIYFEEMDSFPAGDYAGGTLTFTAIFNEVH